MAFTFKSLLPTPELIKAEFPLSDEAVELKEKRDKEIAAVFTGESDKFLVIIGRARRTGRTLYANTWSGWPGSARRWATS